MVKNAALKDAANWAAMKLGYARGVKEEQLEVVCLPFAFELLGETEEKQLCV